ncbi:MAG: LamG domain-containing protein [Spirochaetaceae bacterium]|nr:LamG domain-containing protein [Spirochaetaceae bacterium]
MNEAIPTADRAGSPNSAFYFDGVAANIVLGNGTDLNYTDLMSFSCWFRADDLGSADRIVSKRSSPVAAGWEINIGSTDKITTNRAGTLNSQADNPGITPGVWHHLAFIWEPSAAVEQIKLYLDGVYLSGAVLYAGASLEPPVSAEPLTLGMPAYAAVLLFNGAIDDVRFYHRILSPAEVTTLAAEPAIP